MGENDRLARHHRKRFAPSEIQQIVIAVVLLAAVVAMGYVLWRVFGVFQQLEAGLPHAD